MLPSEWTLLQTTWGEYCADFRWIMAILISSIQYLWILMVPLAKSYWAHVVKMTIAELLFFRTGPRWFSKPIFYVNVGIVLFDAAKEATPKWWKAEEWLPYRATTAGPDKQTVDALASFFHRPWWERTWVIQEMISSRHATFYCGSRRLTVAELYDALDHILRKIYAHKGANKSPYAGSAFKVAQRFTNFVDNESSLSLLRSSLLYLLCVFSESKASDPKDKIYGLLGLATDKVRIEPDYNKSVEDVYIETAKRIITSSGNLDLLNASGILNEGSEYHLPSWVPDWTVDHHFALDHMLSPSEPYNLIKNDERIETQARFQASFSEDGRVLKVHGVVVASLVGVPDIISVSGVRSSEWRGQSYDLLLGVLLICSSIIDWYIDQHPLYVPFFSHMAAKNVLNLGHFWQHMADLTGKESARSRARQRLIGSSANFTSIYAADPTGPKGKPWTIWRWDLNKGYGSSPLMVGDLKGRTFMEGARAGDLLVFCLGTRQPYLIRKLASNNSDRTERSHKLVGPVTLSDPLFDSMVWRDLKTRLTGGRLMRGYYLEEFKLV
ncbi:hypothetical protein N0V83_004847 [Neocucurbitaria cava]|uniref:Heterokaryon incompatibility domain-containing protein n=1 Tax=Neocucurbitaria cava TaxID=798079 RepID=A0A9W9CNK0_9PLEO|nr:hypothetical protein N0V83_004847 [Neocucurbitaria cava]